MMVQIKLEQKIFKEMNHTMISPSSDETGQVIPIQKNATDLGGNITENAKNIVANIGERNREPN